jgi:hypothetical protein
MLGYVLWLNQGLSYEFPKERQGSATSTYVFEVLIHQVEIPCGSES